MKHSPAVARLIDALRTLPGVGPKTAQRMAFHLLQDGREGARRLAEGLENALANVTRCRQCRMFTESELCAICAAPQRDASLLCVVESPADVVAVEQSGGYRGRYFVLMGHLHKPVEKRFEHEKGSGLYINTGDWLSHRTYAEFDGTTLSLRRLDDFLQR